MALQVWRTRRAIGHSEVTNLGSITQGAVTTDCLQEGLTEVGLRPEDGTLPSGPDSRVADSGGAESCWG